MLLRYEFRQLEEQVMMPVGDIAGTYVKEFALGKMHGQRSFEAKVYDSIAKLQANINQKNK